MAGTVETAAPADDKEPENFRRFRSHLGLYVEGFNGGGGRGCRRRWCGSLAPKSIGNGFVWWEFQLPLHCPQWHVLAPASWMIGARGTGHAPLFPSHCRHYPCNMPSIISPLCKHTHTHTLKWAKTSEEKIHFEQQGPAPIPINPPSGSLQLRPSPRPSLPTKYV